MTEPSRAGQLRVLAVTPHPDDELFCGALLAAATAHGACCLVLCATRGEAGQRRDTDAEPSLPLGELRPRELRAACDALSVEELHLLGWADGAPPEFTVAQTHLTHEINKHAPDVLISFGPDGAYGHRDHLALTAALGAALSEMESQACWLQMSFPQGLFRGLFKALRRLPGGPVDAALRPSDLWPPTPSAGSSPARRYSLRRPDQAHPPGRRGALDLSIAKAFDAKLRAMAAHGSQLKAGEPLSFLSAPIAAHMLTEEAYVLARGRLPDVLAAIFGATGAA